MLWREEERQCCKWTVSTLRSTCLSIGVAVQLSAVHGECDGNYFSESFPYALAVISLVSNGFV